MKKTLFYILLTICLTSCLNFKANLAFKLVGAFDDSIKLSKLSSNEKEVVFIPMHHLGTKLFYEDVKTNIDSLKKEGYFFYTEEVSVKRTDTITIRKAIRITGIPFSKDNSGYKHYFDSIYNGKVRLKKELMNQPKYFMLGLDSLNSENVDVTYRDMVNYYENKYGEIILQPCDFEKSFYEIPNCKEKAIEKSQRRELIIDFRNRNVVNTILKEKRKKIAIIYGEDHFKGIKEELLKQGFKIEQN
ncbi:hypothetical protein [Flavobacterium wongokense]|uniref:hypothetical protein n=1 Tax=Flavobacterium wongokense TaxID=2910674 RepID=UPI001F3C8967|nr:hypothetical protein [Flavobacterium sp. WG47]MCF6131303.1 hypothetical protein [Flavobacterium sp. WG47]